MQRLTAVVTIAILLISGTAPFVNFVCGSGDGYTNVSGIINTDTVWTKANSPYRLNGPVAVDKNVTLTIEQGVQVFLQIIITYK